MSWTNSTVKFIDNQEHSAKRIGYILEGLKDKAEELTGFSLIWFKIKNLFGQSTSKKQSVERLYNEINSDSSLFPSKNTSIITKALKFEQIRSLAIKEHQAKFCIKIIKTLEGNHQVFFKIENEIIYSSDYITDRKSLKDLEIIKKKFELDEIEKDASKFFNPNSTSTAHKNLSVTNPSNKVYSNFFGLTISRAYYQPDNIDKKPASMQDLDDLDDFFEDAVSDVSEEKKSATSLGGRLLQFILSSLSIHSRAADIKSIM